jgi:uncharacterized membrane protein YgcG
MRLVEVATHPRHWLRFTAWEALAERTQAKALLYARRRFHPWLSILAEIYLCHTWSCHEILRMETPGQAGGEGGGDDVGRSARRGAHIPQPQHHGGGDGGGGGAVSRAFPWCTRFHLG